MRRIPTVVIVVLVLLAGCSGASQPSTSTPVGSTTPTLDATTSTATSSTATPTTSTTAPEATRVSADNPWGVDPVRVAIVTIDERNRSFEPLVETALRYWETNASNYTDFSVNYTLVDRSVDADLVIRFQEALPVNASRSDRLGDAPLNPSWTAGLVDDQQTIRIRTGYTNATTVRTIEHELGHTLGIDHGESPMPLMSPVDSGATTLPLRNASDLAYPWESKPLRVHLDVHGANPDRTRTQVQHALDYYADGADGWMAANASFVWVDSDAEANVSIDVYEYTKDTDVVDDPGSVGVTWGTDPDHDGALEHYTNFTVTVAGIDEDAVGWHVGYWLSAVFGSDSDEPHPRPFRNAGYHDRHSRWWN